MDCSDLKLKPNHQSLPFWVTNKGHFFLETFNSFYEEAYDFIMTIADPICVTESIQQFKINEHSFSIGLQTGGILDGLQRLSKNQIPQEFINFIVKKTKHFNKLKITIRNNRYFLESSDCDFLDSISNNCKTIQQIRVISNVSTCPLRNLLVFGFCNTAQYAIPTVLIQLVLLYFQDDFLWTITTNNDHKSLLYSVEFQKLSVEQIKKALFDMQYSFIEEYEYRNDASTPTLSFSVNANVHLRPYQSKCLSKIFANGRLRSGIIVLPYGSGKSFIGMTVMTVVAKSTIILTNTTNSAREWCQQLKKWTNIDKKLIIEFTSQNKQELPCDAAFILVTTYHMLGHSGRRSREAQRLLNKIIAIEWGLLIADELHSAHRNTVRKCISDIHVKSKLGLSAKLKHENYQDFLHLIGPKLYYESCHRLQHNGYLKTVEFIDVQCEMDPYFYDEYLLNESNNRRHSQILVDFNPNKYRAMQHLIETHEQKKDKILVVSDNIPLLKHCAKTLKKPFFYGRSGDEEKKYWLQNFNNSSTNCLFMSSDVIPSCLLGLNVVIQISGHVNTRYYAGPSTCLARAIFQKDGNCNDNEKQKAYFYRLVSKDTNDMFYVVKRQRIIMGNGYHFRVCTNICNNSQYNLRYSTSSERKDLLLHVLTLIKNGSRNSGNKRGKKRRFSLKTMKQAKKLEERRRLYLPK